MIINAVKQYTASVTREAFDFVMIGSGVGGVLGGATELTFAIAVADIVVGSADLVISSTEQDIINWLGDKKGKEVLNLWTDVTAIYGSGVTVRAVTPWLYSKSLLLHNHLQTIDWTKVPGTVNPSTVRLFKLYKVKLEKIFSEAGNVFIKLDELGLAALKTKINSFDESFKVKFLEDFTMANDDILIALNNELELVDSWKVLADAGETGLSGRIKDIEFVDEFLKKNPGKAGTVANDIKNKGWQKWVDEVSQVGLANYSNVRKYLANSRTKQYLTNQELLDFEKILKQAHPDVLKHMNEMDEFDFAEMVRGYRDLKNNGKLSTFDNAIKSGENFYGNYGWLSYWKLTAGIKYSLTTIDDLKKAGKLLPTGNATDIQLASLQAFTRSGDFINVPMRYNSSFMGDYA